jgi:hypothetical protein
MFCLLFLLSSDSSGFIGGTENVRNSAAMPVKRLTLHTVAHHLAENMGYKKCAKAAPLWSCVSSIRRKNGSHIFGTNLILGDGPLQAQLAN